MLRKKTSLMLRASFLLFLALSLFFLVCVCVGEGGFLGEEQRERVGSLDWIGSTWDG